MLCAETMDSGKLGHIARQSGLSDDQNGVDGAVIFHAEHTIAVRKVRSSPRERFRDHNPVCPGVFRDDL